MVEAESGFPQYRLKKLAPVQLKKNHFSLIALEAQQHGATKEEELSLLGRKREMQGIFEGNLEEGELEMGQSSGMVSEILTCEQVVRKLLMEYESARQMLEHLGGLS